MVIDAQTNMKTGRRPANKINRE